jgi:pyruvate-formate lyase-activating enzyme
MKWQNKGHEFDELGETFKRNKDIVLIGTGFENGCSWVKHDLRTILAFLEPRVRIEAYEYLPVSINDHPLPVVKHGLFYRAVKKILRNDLIKKLMLFGRKKTRNELEIFLHTHGLDKGGRTIVVNYGNPITQEQVTNLLEKTGRFQRHTNLFMALEFFEKYLSIFSTYVIDKVFFWHSNIVVTTICNLNCKYCLNFQPFVKHPRHRPLDEVKRDMDIYFAAVDYTGYFQLTGGEPLLYPHFGELIEYLGGRYKDKVGQILFATNGTRIPNDDLCGILKKYHIHVIVDNYTLAAPETLQSYEELIVKLQKHGISYTAQEKNTPFITMFPTSSDILTMTEQQLVTRAPGCSDGYIMFQENRNGRLYFCNYHSFAATAGIIDETTDDFFELSNMNFQRRKELVEFRLGYSNKGITSFCRFCNGQLPVNTLPRRPAGEQIHGRFNWDINNPTKVEGF